MKKRAKGKSKRVLRNKADSKNKNNIKSNVGMHKPYLLLVFLLLVFAIAFLGNIFMGDGVYSDWYESVKPAITPPAWVFGVVWMIIYFLIAVSLYFAWINARTKKEERNLVIIYGLNLIANALWTYFFFSLKNPLIALYDLGFIWVTIICMIVCTWDVDRKASYLLIPYFLWVSFAGVLNFLIYLKA